MSCFFLINCNTHKTKRMNYKLDFGTGHNQFYLSDKSAVGNDRTLWSNEEFKARLAVAEGFLAIGIETYGNVKGSLSILKSKPELEDLAKYDHVIKSGMNLSSGVLQVLDCPFYNVELELKLEPGSYGVIVYSSNLYNSNIDEDEGPSFYKIVIWPDNDIETKVLKQYSN